ncbi:MAG: alpha/beta hydrolase [Ignavibacteria bacterium]|nr:alpha/beta hydrolase [Ignavibacteria bacterium]
MKQVKINGAEINYTDHGSGEPIVFVHGVLEDYRTWEAQTNRFSKNYRVISYSRRFNFPNKNTEQNNNFSAITESEDLAEFIKQLKPGPVHLTGHSFGGLISLFLTKKYPELVQTLTLSEPALISWLPRLKDGKILYKNFYDQLWNPVKQAFEVNDTQTVLKHILKYFAGEDIIETLPDEVKTQFLVNIPEWHAVVYSSDPFSDFKKEYFEEIKVPVLLLSGGQTLPIIKLTNKELRNTLPDAKSYHLAEGTHDYWITNPAEMGDAVLKFLRSV